MDKEIQVIFNLPHNLHMKWYHWFLYPFAKKFFTWDDNIYMTGFRIFGKIYITKIKDIINE